MGADAAPGSASRDEEPDFVPTGDITIVYADVNGDGSADFEIKQTGLVMLSAGDFLI